MSPLSRRLTWAFALIGLAASLTSLYVHHQLVLNPSYSSFCDINATFSCNEAYLSRYGSLRGIPVAFFGVLWFLGVLLLALTEARGPAVVKEAVPGYLFAVATVGLAVVLYLGYAAFFILKAVCVMCLTTYAAVIGLFIVSGIATSLPMTTLPRRLFSDLRAMTTRPALLALAVLFLAGAVSSVVFFPVSAWEGKPGQQAVAAPTADQQSEFARWYEAQPRVTVPVSADGAAVLILKFTDLQCPSCGQTYFGYRPVIAKYQGQYPGAVKYVVKDYPLNPDCNQYSRMLHPAACDAAVAVRLARRNGKGDELEEHFYSHQAMMSPASVREAAANIGKVTDWDAQYERTIAQIKLDVGLGRLLNITQTPTFFINGVKIVGLTPEGIDMAIAYELRKAGKLK